MEGRIDAIDRQILKILETNAKTSPKEIAARLNMSKTPVYERVRKLEKEGYISKYVALVNKAKVESSITVFSFVSLEAQQGRMMDEFANSIKQYNEVVECFVVGGEFDFLLKIIVKDLDAYFEFSKNKVASLPHIGTVKSAFVLNEAKYTTEFPLLE
jgi:DNA-binding Lrp family transcriptional regulator